MNDPEDRPIKWGMIGCGDVTELKSGPAFSLVKGSELVAVMRRDKVKAADYALRHGVKRWYSDAEELLNDPQINAVYIATPPSSHKEYAIRALKKGLNVYLEKPVTLNAQEARDIVEMCSASRARLSVAHYRRALPMFIYVKDLLDTHAIGDVRTVRISMWQVERPKLIADTVDNWRLNPEVSGGGYFHDLAPHQLDLMVYFFGRPLLMTGFACNQSATTAADDHVTGVAQFASDICLTGSWSFNVSEADQVDECLIVGSEGSIRFPFFGRTVTLKTSEPSNEQVKEFEMPKHIQQPMIEHVVNFFQNESPNPCSIDDALLSLEMMDAFSIH